MLPFLPMRGDARKCLVALLGLILLAGPLPAQQIGVKVAFLAIENLSGDPRYDYLSGITQGIFLYDLSRVGRITLLDRNALEDVLKEQELRLSGIADSEALQVGRLMGADWLLKGGYVFLGEDVLLNMTVIDVVTGRTTVFSDRGRTENMIHRIAEKVTARLSGEQLTFVGDNDRSIISLKDETPATIALHSHLIDARIFLDGEFVGYTTGDRRVPYLIENLRPGEHTIGLKLSNFGTVREPEITFHDWEETVQVQPGRRHVIQAKAYHFNDTVYRLMQLLREDIRLSLAEGRSPVIRKHDASFVDRESRRVAVGVRLETRPVGDDLEVGLTVDYDDQRETLTLTSKKGEELELERPVGKVKIGLSLDFRYGDRYQIEYAISRTDIGQNMWY